MSRCLSQASDTQHGSHGEQGSQRKAPPLPAGSKRHLLQYSGFNLGSFFGLNSPPASMTPTGAPVTTYDLSHKNMLNTKTPPSEGLSLNASIENDAKSSVADTCKLNRMLNQWHWECRHLQYAGQQQYI